MSASSPAHEAALAVLARFALDGAVDQLVSHGGGLINDSWQAAVRTAAGRQRFLLQRINRHVFRRPHDVMENMVRVTRHVASRLEREGTSDPARRVLSLVPARDGTSHVVDEQGETWRLVRWVEGTRSVERAASETEAHATALAFGRFLRLLHDLPGPPLRQTIPGFHDTPARLAAFERTVAEDRAARRGGCRPEIEALLDRRRLAVALEAPAREGLVPERPVHNDAKIANVLFDASTGEALCVVDLDTVMPGLSAHDFGDLARTTVSDSDEDERDLRRVSVRPSFLAALTRGFVEGAGAALSAAEREHLGTGALVITYEQALRFAADHLDGDRYYRIARPGHNLDRARAQLALVESLERTLAAPARA